ncbi:kinase-like protein [Clavulina sp. PMI_390]|nr:kinase-like protein [Clavulina sp. PMI_390]
MWSRLKTVSASDQKTPKPVALPPMQISALSSSTASRVASLKPRDSRDSVLMPPPASTARSRASVASITPRAPANKNSDSSLRSTRQNLPPIAGSPSVGTYNSHPPVSGHPRNSIDTKETPTKIPRISSRSSTLQSPAVAKSSAAATVSGVGRRSSLVVAATTGTKSVDATPSPGPSVSDFGVLETSDAPSSHGTTPVYSSTSRERGPLARTASQQSVTRKPSIPPIAGSSSVKKPPTASTSAFAGLRKSSAPTISSSTSSAQSDSQGHGLSAKLAHLTPSKSFKLLSPKVSLPVTRTSPAISQMTPATPMSGRQTGSTPSPVSSNAEDDEIAADEEMMEYVKRTQARKIASGATKEELDNLYKFPEPFAPTPASTSASLLRSSQSAYLSPFEKSEILDFHKVYCIGAHSQKTQATPEITTNNYGYDDERGDYIVIPGDHLAYRYEIVEVLGKGSFGQVLQCKDHATGGSVAVKIIRNKKRFHHQALVEIKILENLRQWDPENKHHVIQMQEHFYFRDHLCIVMELLSINLYELIKANQFAGFSTVLIRRFTVQMLRSLVLMRHHRVVHCDLKPENVLLRHPAKSGLKVIDFGSSCFEHEKVYTYIQSRFYRSPEVILGLNYHMAIDMWSLGCILAELYTGYPIFPGENEQEQLACIMEVLGVPDKEIVARSGRKNLFFDRTGAPRPVVNSRGRRRRAGSKTLAQVLRCDEENFVDFIAKCLHWDPERRLKPQNALRHPFITANRRKPPVSTAPAAARLLASSSSSRVKTSTLETPKKTQIGAPTPLTARTPGTRLAPGPSVPATPITSGTSMHTLSSSTSQSARHRSSYRTEATAGLSYHHSTRNLTNGYSVCLSLPCLGFRWLTQPPLYTVHVHLKVDPGITLDGAGTI